MSAVSASKTNRAIELDEKIELLETLWSGGLVPTGMIVEDINELIAILESMEEKAPIKKPVTVYIRRMKRKRTKYQKVMMEEEE